MSPVAKERLGKAALTLWLPVTLAIVASLMVSHVVAMPSPTDGARLRDGVSALRRGDGPFRLHVLYERCSCTRSLWAHLMERGAQAGVDELILYVGADPERAAEARRRGYRFARRTPEALSDTLGLDAAPLFVVAEDEIAYVGGYYALPAAVDPRDEAIVRALAGGEPVAPLPIYGCAVSPALQDQVDPLGLVY